MLFRDTTIKTDQYPFTRDEDAPNPYYEGLLNPEDAELLKEWNYIENAIDNYFSQRDEIKDDFSYGDDIDTVLTKVHDGLMAFITGERDEVVTSMLDHMPEDEYKANYRKVYGVDPD